MDTILKDGSINLQVVVILGLIACCTTVLYFGRIRRYEYATPSKEAVSIAEPAEVAPLEIQLSAPSTPPPVAVTNRSSRSMSDRLESALDVEAFLRKLREEGISVLRLKAKVLKPKQLRLNDHGDLYWSKSWFPKPISLSSLENVIDPISSDSGFILEFKGRKLLNLRIPEHEFPFDTASVASYFKTIRRILNRDHEFIARFVSDNAIRKPFVEDDITETKSETSELTTTTASSMRSRVFTVSPNVIKLTSNRK